MDYVETNCVIEHQGRKFESGGAVVTDDFILAYVGKQPEQHTFLGETPYHELTDWHGKPIGTIRLTSSWPTPRSYFSSRMHQGYACVDGVWYTGRTAGQGMVFKGRKVKSK